MATITLTANTNVSALSLSNDDTIDLAGFQLNMDVQPTVTGIQVISPGTAGTVVFPVACLIPTWSFSAGTANMIVTLPANCEIGAVTGGSGGTACVTTNNGRISGVVSGSATSTVRGVFTNSATGVISGPCVGGSGGANAAGVQDNNGRITGPVTGAPVGASRGVATNNGTISGAVTASAAAHAVLTNNGIITGMVMGDTTSTRQGVNANNGSCIGGLKDNVGTAIGTFTGQVMVVNGPLTEIAFPATIRTIYTLGGPLNPNSTFASGTTIVTSFATTSEQRHPLALTAANTFFSSDGTGLTVFITVSQDKSHVDPDNWPIANDPAIVLSSHPSASKVVTKVATGVYKVEWSALSPPLTNGQVVTIAIDGAIAAAAWSTWVMPLQVVLTPPTPANVWSHIIEGLEAKDLLFDASKNSDEIATRVIAHLNEPIPTEADASQRHADLLANQTQIIGLIAGGRVVQVPSPNVDGNLVLTQGDTYDDIGNPRARWIVDTDYTDGWGVGLTIRDKDDNVVYFNAGAVDSATAVSVAIDAPTGLPMQGCPGVWQGKFDVELTKNQSIKTIARGVVYIYEDQTR